LKLTAHHAVTPVTACADRAAYNFFCQLMSEYDDNDYDDDTGERTVSELEDVHSMLTEILNTLRSMEGNSISVVITTLILIIAFFSVWDWVWDSKIRYAVQCSTSTGNVMVEKQPQNCDIFFAPIGKKGCSYKKNVTVTKRANDVKTGRRIISHDGGKTWDWDDNDTVPQGVNVYVDWNKVEE
jgi:hypothetical protein